MEGNQGTSPVVQGYGVCILPEETNGKAPASMVTKNPRTGGCGGWEAPEGKLETIRNSGSLD